MPISRRGYNWNNRFCHQTGWPVTGWAYKVGGLITGILWYIDV